MVRAGARPAVPRVWVLVALAAVILVGVLAVRKQLRDANDFPIYWNAARALLAGRSPYEVGTGLHGYVYLPWFAVAIVPLAMLPLPAAAWCWYALNIVFIVYACRALLGALRAGGVELRPPLLALATLPLLGLFVDDLLLGQANLLLLWLVALGIRATLRPGAAEHRGVPLGLASALKMPAAVLALPLLLAGRLRHVLGVAIALAIAIGGPLVEGGSSGGVRLLEDWRAKVLAPAVAGTLQGSNVIDQSPQAALRRLLVAEPAFGDRSVNVAALDPATFARVSRWVSVVFLAGYLLFWLVAPARGSPLALVTNLAMGCCAMVQLTGFSLKAQFVVLLLPACLAASLAWRRPGRGPRIALGIAAALFLLSQPGLVGRTASNWMLAYSSMALGTLLLTKTLAWLRLTQPPSAAPAASPARGTAR